MVPARPSTAIPMIPCIGDALGMHLRFAPSSRRFLASLHCSMFPCNPQPTPTTHHPLPITHYPPRPASSPVYCPCLASPPPQCPVKQPPDAFFQHPSSARFHRQTALTPQKRQFRQDAVSGQALTGHGHLPKIQVAETRIQTLISYR
jgi:hypothetical protein